MDELDELLELQKVSVAALVFDPEHYTCSEEELLVSDRKFGESLAARWIAFAQTHCKTIKKQREELRWVCRYVCAFPASSVYSLPLLIAEIRRLEEESIMRVQIRATPGLLLAEEQAMPYPEAPG